MPSERRATEYVDIGTVSSGRAWYLQKVFQAQDIVCLMDSIPLQDMDGRGTGCEAINMKVLRKDEERAREIVATQRAREGE